MLHKASDAYRKQGQDAEACSELSVATNAPLTCKALVPSDETVVNSCLKPLPGKEQRNDHCLRRWTRRSKATLAILWERPLLLAVSLLVFGALCSAGLAAVLTASSLEVASSRDLAANGIGSQVAASLKQALKTSCFGADLLGAVVVQMPYCAALNASWGSITADIMSRVDPNVVQQLELDMAGVIWKAHPPFGPGLEFLYGRDLLKEPDDRPGMLYMLQERRTLILGPYTCKAGFKCAFTVTPVFLPAANETYDWGCGFQPYNCTDLCWDPDTKTKFWGQVSTMLNLDPFFSRSDDRLVMLSRRGYDYKLWQKKTSSSNPYVLFANTTEWNLQDPVVQRIEIENLVWYLELAPRDGWVPAWRAPCIAAVVIGSVLVALLVLWLLLSKERHNRLLRAMLPTKVISQLQSGAQAIAEHFDSVTVLFSDIVGYTTVASQLTPFQVVTLLNELFSVFDELTQRNGVYKVETIGDALMCVSGCPVPEDAATNARRIARMALDMVAAVEQFRPSLEGVRLRIRVGIHSGPVVAGVVGKKMPRYCLFGDTVNTASRMESTSEPMKVQVSATTAALLNSLPGDVFILEPRGPVVVKGKGSMETFFLRESSPACAVSGRSNSVSVIVSRPVPSVTVLRPSGSPMRSRTQSRTCVELLPQGAGGTWLANGGSVSGAAIGTSGGGANGACGGGGSDGVSRDSNSSFVKRLRDPPSVSSRGIPAPISNGGPHTVAKAVNLLSDLVGASESYSRRTDGVGDEDFANGPFISVDGSGGADDTKDVAQQNVQQATAAGAAAAAIPAGSGSSAEQQRERAS